MTGLSGPPTQLCVGRPASPTAGPTKDTEGQVQAKAPGCGELDLVVVQRAVGEHALLDGRLHRVLWTDRGGSWEGCRGAQHTEPPGEQCCPLRGACAKKLHADSVPSSSHRPTTAGLQLCASLTQPGARWILSALFLIPMSVPPLNSPPQDWKLRKTKLPVTWPCHSARSQPGPPTGRVQMTFEKKKTIEVPICDGSWALNRYHDVLATVTALQAPAHPPALQPLRGAPGPKPGSHHHSLLTGR